MRSDFQTALLVLLLSTPAAANAAAEPQAEETVRRKVNEWFAAQAGNDAEALSAILDEHFIGATPAGAMLTKADVLALGGTACAALAGASLKDVQVNLAGDTAVANGVMELAHDRFHFTETFVHQDGRWQMIAGQAAHIE